MPHDDRIGRRENTTQPMLKQTDLAKHIIDMFGCGPLKWCPEPAGNAILLLRSGLVGFGPGKQGRVVGRAININVRTASGRARRGSR
jgi:hypothetical protein